MLSLSLLLFVGLISLFFFVAALECLVAADSTGAVAIPSPNPVAIPVAIGVTAVQMSVTALAMASAVFSLPALVFIMVPKPGSIPGVMVVSFPCCCLTALKLTN